MVGEEVGAVKKQVFHLHPQGEEAAEDLLLDPVDAGPGEDRLPVLILLVRPEEQAKGGEHGAVAGIGTGPVEGEAALGIPALHLAAAQGALGAAQDLEEDETGRGLGGLPVERQGAFQGREETGPTGGVEQRRLPSKGECSELEALRTCGEAAVEGVGGPDVDLTDVAGALARDAGLLDDVEVAVTAAGAELEYPTHSGAT